MKKKIIDALKLKFEGVSDSILERMAEKLAKTVTAEDGVQPAVDAVTFQQLLEQYGDSRASEASATAVKNYEAKYKIKDGKPTAPQTQDPPEGEPKGGEADQPKWVETLISANKAMMERLTALEGKNTENRRLEAIKTALKDVPESLSKIHLGNFERMNFKDDDDFNAWVETVKAETTELANEFKSAGSGVAGTKGHGGGAAEPTAQDIEDIVSQFQ